MLLCADGSFYIGVTNDVERRLAEHELGIDRHCYTFTRRPVKLVHASDFHEVTDAIAWEKQLKRWSHAKKAALIDSDWKEIHRLAKCTNDSSATLHRRASFDSAQDDTESFAQDDTESFAQDDTESFAQDDTESFAQDDTESSAQDDIARSAQDDIAALGCVTSLRSG